MDVARPKLPAPDADAGRALRTRPCSPRLIMARSVRPRTLRTLPRPRPLQFRPEPYPGLSGASDGSACAQLRTRNLRLPHLVAIIVGAGVALLVSSAGGPGAFWGKIPGLLSPQTDSPVSSGTLSDRDLDRQRPQKQAKILLERAVTRSEGTENQGQARVEAQIEARLDAWRGTLKWDAQLAELTTVALNSNDQSVRASAIEVQLAAYGLTKSESTVDALVRQADSPDHAQKIWALWALGLLGNRGVEANRMVQVLTAHLKGSGKNSDSDSDSDQTKTRAVGPSKAWLWWEQLQLSCPCSTPCTMIPRR